MAIRPLEEKAQPSNIGIASQCQLNVASVLLMHEYLIGGGMARGTLCTDPTTPGLSNSNPKNLTEDFDIAELTNNTALLIEWTDS